MSFLVEPQVTAADVRKANQKSESTRKTLAKPCNNAAKLTVGPFGKRNIYFETKLVSSLPTSTSPYSRECPRWEHLNGLSRMQAPKWKQSVQGHLMVMKSKRDTCYWCFVMALCCYVRNCALLLSLDFLYPLGADGDNALLFLHPPPLLGTIKMLLLHFVPLSGCFMSPNLFFLPVFLMASV